MTTTSRHVSIDGSGIPIQFVAITKNGILLAYNSTSSSDFSISDLIFSSNDSPEVVYHAGGADSSGVYLFLYVNIIIIGA